MAESIGVYISVPFCRAKCSYCNFASGVFGPERMDGYIHRLCEEIGESRARADRIGAFLPPCADTVYFGGGTPSLLRAEQIRRVFRSLRAQFELSPDAEITLECAPGQLSDETLEAFLAEGGNRVSLGVQSFVDRESRAVGRLHTRESCLAEIARLRAAGVGNLNVDLIAGLPHGTAASWRESVETALETGVPHVSVYMLEVDEDSRLGREMMAAGERYGAGNTPPEDEVADWYTSACACLDEAELEQYEISNFARPGFASRHNMKYWLREPYVGFGLDAHSMLRTQGVEAVRWANPDLLEDYMGSLARQAALPVLGTGQTVERIGGEQAFEETLFLGLRMNAGLELLGLRSTFGDDLVDRMLDGIGDAEQAGLIEQRGGWLRLTSSGRMVSNEVFGRLLVEPA